MDFKHTPLITNHAALQRVHDAIPTHALACLNCLEAGGYETWFVGGFVRDSLMGRKLHDIDISTAAPWQETKRLCTEAGYSVHETGTQHGTVSVVVDNHVMEVTTFRTEEGYFDHRHPNTVTPARTIIEDLARRDFTINAMAFHPNRGLVDPFGGMQDLNAQVIRCVGEPRLRFNEDALRIIRAIRFASQLGFTLEEETRTALFERKGDLELVAGERLRVELERFLTGDYVREALMDYADALAVIMPEISLMKGLDQRTRYHCYDVLEHTAYVIEYVPKTDILCRWAALFHDMGKPECFTVDEAGVGHMQGHEAASVGHLSKAAYRLRFSSRRTHDLKLLVRHHDFRPTITKKNVRKLYAKLEFRDDLMPVMCNLMRADALAHAPEYHERANDIDTLEALFYTMKEQGDALSAQDLAITGNDLRNLGLEEGPEVGEMLEEIFLCVSDEKVANTRTDLLSLATLLIASKTPN